MLRGGSGSTKTYSVCQAIALWLITGQLLSEPPLLTGKCSVVRKHSATHDKAALWDFRNIIRELGVRDLIRENKTSKTFTYDDGKNQRVVEFFGADDEQKVRGPRRDYLYCNEANELSFKEEFNQLNMRTHCKVIVDFNPDDPYSWLNQEIELKRAVTKGDVDIEVSTHWDNPFMSKMEHDEIENLKHIDNALWRIYAKGEYGRIEGLVFPKVRTIRNGVPNAAEFVGYGLDFGYSNHPSALVGVWMAEDNVYLEEKIYETGLTNDDLADKFDALGIDRRDKIFADSAEPKSIEELRRKGYNVVPAKKGRDSIVYGINLMKQYNLWVPEASSNVIKEFRKYKWTEDRKTKELTNVPVDAFNHAIDGIRYVFMERINKKKGPGALRKLFSRKTAPPKKTLDVYD